MPLLDTLQQAVLEGQLPSINTTFGVLDYFIPGMVQERAAAEDREFQAGIARENLQYQKDLQEYQKGLQQQLFAREDSAAQRRAADLERAGLSKTLAAGGAASAGPVVGMSAPQFKPEMTVNPKLAKAQEYGQLLQSVLSINKQLNDVLQQKQSIAQSKAQEKLVSVEADEKEYNLDWYKTLGLSTDVGKSQLGAAVVGGSQSIFNQIRNFNNWMDKTTQQVMDTFDKYFSKVKFTPAPGSEKDKLRGWHWDDKLKSFVED